MCIPNCTSNFICFAFWDGRPLTEMQAGKTVDINAQ